MTALRVVVFGLFGLLIGSFNSVLVHRIPRKESVVAPRSRCPVCGTQIRALDNVPVVSWVLLRGRCRACGERIGGLYPLLELATGALYVGAALRFDRLLPAVLGAVLMGLMPAVGLIDLRHRIIPNLIVYPAFVGSAVAIVLGDSLDVGVDLIDGAIGLAAYGGAFFLIAIISPRGMGMGDVKLNALTGLVLGSIHLPSVGVAAGAGILLGGVGALIAMARGAGRRGAIPFGPFLAAGAVVGTLFGPDLADLYLRTLS
ncbi:MAG TPA: prepilin peptidase [Actinomycetota bacterium]|nr:prepilin peptidase [Actinomycetota bacterium]